MAILRADQPSQVSGGDDQPVDAVVTELAEDFARLLALAGTDELPPLEVPAAAQPLVDDDVAAPPDQLAGARSTSPAMQ